MIILKTMEQLLEAKKKAEKVKPKMRVIKFGLYHVQGSRGNWYEITCRKNDRNDRLVYCSCEDEFPRKQNQACYHMIPAIGIHTLLALSLQSVIFFGLDETLKALKEQSGN